jgi:hypothetical protein
MNKVLRNALLLLFIAMGCHRESSLIIDKTIPGDFLSDTKYDKLIVEIQYVNGNQPAVATVDKLKAFLQQRLNKTAGITIIQNALSPTGKSAYSVADVQNIENANRTQKTSGKTLTAYFFFADGDYAGNSGNSKVLGFAYGSSSMALFEKTIKEYSGGVTQPSVTVLETTVLLHEFGHTLGLVNNGTSMQLAHQDATHGKHCDDQNCLMYYTAETSDIIANIVSGNIPTLDTHCLDDLKANGGK